MFATYIIIQPREHKRYEVIYSVFKSMHSIDLITVSIKQL